MFMNIHENVIEDSANLTSKIRKIRLILIL
jgi:hypothetical protein